MHRGHELNLTATLDLTKLTSLDELSDGNLAEFEDDEPLTPTRRQAQRESLSLTATLNLEHLAKVRELCAQELVEIDEHVGDDEDDASSVASTEMSSPEVTPTNARVKSGLLQPGFSSVSSMADEDAPPPPAATVAPKSQRPKSPTKRKKRVGAKKGKRVTAKHKSVFEEFNNLRKTIDNGDCDWKQRVATLESVSEAISDGKILSLPKSLYNKLITHLKFALCTQLCDLRSGVFKAACATVTHMATVMGERGKDFSPVLESTCPILLQHHYVTIYVMRMSSIECMRTLSMVCNRHKLINLLHKNSSETHKEVRAEISDYLYRIVHDRHDEGTLDESDVNLVLEVIDRNLNDRDQNVRKNTRKLHEVVTSLYTT